MNITDYLVEYLKQGNFVEIPNIGVLASKTVDAHYDAASATFFPTCRTIELASGIFGESKFVKHLADKECVSLATAQQMWQNYNGAMAAKFEKDGCCVIGDLGSLYKENGLYRFEASEGLNLNDNTLHMQPVGGVREYTSSANPFDKLEESYLNKAGALLTGEIEVEPEPEPVLNVEPEPIPEPVKEPVSEPELEPEPIVIIESTPEPVVETEPKSTPEVERKLLSFAEPAPDPEAVSEPQFSNPTHEAESESADGIAFIPEPDGEDDPLDALKQLDNIEESNGEPFAETEKKEKKKRKSGFGKVLLWILILLIVLIGCAFVVDRFLFEGKGLNWVEQQLQSIMPSSDNAANESKDSAMTMDFDSFDEEHRDSMAAGFTNDYTFSLEGLHFDETEIQGACADLMSDLDAYVDRYLKSRNSTQFKQALIMQMNDYASTQLTARLTDNECYSQTLLFNGDYVREASMPMLKDQQMKRQRCNVCGELMNYDMLDQMLNDITGSEVVGVPEPVVPAAPVAKQQKNAPVRSNILTSSKKGFDVIAGFYAKKSNADRHCQKLKSSGCDAYIIEKNGYFYVSMGSAASRTEVDKLYMHIKEWYKEDLSIKQW